MSGVHKRGSAWRRVLLAYALSVASSTGAAGAQRSQPDPTDFLAQAKSLLRGNFLLEPDGSSLRLYEWKCVVERLKLDRSFAVTGRETVRSLETFESDGRRRLTVTILENGKPVQVLERSVADAVAVYDPGTPEWTRLRDAVWALTQFAFRGREERGGRAVLVYSFRTSENAPDDGLEPALAASRKNILKAEGRLWFDEEDKALVGVEGQYYGTVTLARGAFASGAKIEKGTRWSWCRTRFNGRDWLPVRKERTCPVSALLPSRRGYIRTIHLFSDFERREGSP